MEGEAEDNLHKSFAALRKDDPMLAYASKKSKADLRLPRTFAEACEDKKWGEAIDREFLALVKRSTWKYIKQTPEMRPVPFTWVFTIKTIDEDRKIFLYKARFCLRGDQQKPYVDYNP